jgi:hypothetical protein
VQQENSNPGNTGWYYYVKAPASSIEGYASQVSVAPGGLLQLHVNAEPLSRYRVEIYRLGWYGGAGGRLMACLPSCSSDKAGTTQTAISTTDQNTGETSANWTVTDSMTIPSNWVSGYYAVKFLLTSGYNAGTANEQPVIVVAPPARQSAALVVVPVNTWQAYNAWGGKSLYPSSGSDDSAAPIEAVRSQALAVSFNRPYQNGNPALTWDAQLVRFLEREGYDVSYTTDVDVDANPSMLTQHRLVFTAGHGEYWSHAERGAFDSALSASTNLAFTGANTSFWQIRYADSRRTIIAYKQYVAQDPETNPELKTTQFRLLPSPALPECQLEGVQYVSAFSSTGHDYTVAAGATDPWFSGTGFATGNVLPGLVGYEWDTVQPGCNVPTPNVQFHYQTVDSQSNADSVRYTASSGARVFSGASLQFSWGLDPSNAEQRTDSRLQQYMRNAIADQLRPAAPTSLNANPRLSGVNLSFSWNSDPRLQAITIYRHAGNQPFSPSDPGTAVVCQTLATTCSDGGAQIGVTYVYAAVARDPWGTSQPIYSTAVTAI